LAEASTLSGILIPSLTSGRGPNSAWEVAVDRSQRLVRPEGRSLPRFQGRVASLKACGRFTRDDPEGSPSVSRPPLPPVSLWPRVGVPLPVSRSLSVRTFRLQFPFGFQSLTFRLQSPFGFESPSWQFPADPTRWRVSPSTWWEK